jgi:hypothetical protein
LTEEAVGCVTTVDTYVLMLTLQLKRKDRLSTRPHPAVAHYLSAIGSSGGGSWLRRQFSPALACRSASIASSFILPNSPEIASLLASQLYHRKDLVRWRLTRFKI